MGFPFLNRRHSEGGRFPRTLFYSVLFHLAVFYILGVDPLSVFRRMESPPEVGAFHVDLLSSRSMEEGMKEKLAFPREKEGKGAGGERRDPPPEEEGILLVESPPPAAPPLQETAKLKAPPGMTGPQDCLLKIVAMVCPNADLQCIAEYQAFCSTLPD